MLPFKSCIPIIYIIIILYSQLLYLLHHLIYHQQPIKFENLLLWCHIVMWVWITQYNCVQKQNKKQHSCMFSRKWKKTYPITSGTIITNYMGICICKLVWLCDQSQGHLTNQMSYHNHDRPCKQPIRFLAVQTHERHVIDTDQSDVLI